MDFGKVIGQALPEILTQLVAFLLVLWILKKYAFGTVFSVLEERQKAIAKSLEDAEKKRLDMEVMRKDYEVRIRSIEQETRQKLQEAVLEGQRIAAEIRAKGQNDAAAQLERAKKEIERETEKAQFLVRKEIVELSALMAGKLIQKNLSDADNRKFVEEALAAAVTSK